MRAISSGVSVLFSEPKIPQFTDRRAFVERRYGFSALQRAENSSTQPKFSLKVLDRSFSALQRAENSSTHLSVRRNNNGWRFSALQRAENSSIQPRRRRRRHPSSFSALQRAENSSTRRSVGGADRAGVSVLFSEPKIPQIIDVVARARYKPPFQCSSASRKFLNKQGQPQAAYRQARFSALQRAENSSITFIAC